MSRPIRTLASAFDPRRNSLNALRLLLAALVIASHSWPVGGYGPDPQIGDQNLGQWAVAGFFVISGYLITCSRMGTSLGSYLWRRFLRIYPAFFVVLVLVAFVAAPLSTVIDGTGTYTVSAGLGYVAHNIGLFITQYTIPGTLTTAPYPDSWNGPLWTLGYEFACYLLIALIITVIPRRWLTTTLIVAFIGGTCATAMHLVVAPESDGFMVRLLRLGVYFLAGSLLFVLKEVIPSKPWLAVLSAGAVVATVATSTFQVFAGLPLAYLMMYLGSALPLTRIGRTNDISYGMYIYAFPVQQYLALTIGPHVNVWVLMTMALVTTVPLAWASWLCVERPAMKLKRLVPTRRAASRSGVRAAAPVDYTSTQ